MNPDDISEIIKVSHEKLRKIEKEYISGFLTTREYQKYVSDALIKSFLDVNK